MFSINRMLLRSKSYGWKMFSISRMLLRSTCWIDDGFYRQDAPTEQILRLVNAFSKNRMLLRSTCWIADGFYKQDAPAEQILRLANAFYKQDAPSEHILDCRWLLKTGCSYGAHVGLTMASTNRMLLRSKSYGGECFL